MSIGEHLTAAQRAAGLSIPDVSQRTRIRETIVREIERDDFSSCGGDFYARGHIRAIAHVLGIDPEPLVREYDAGQAEPEAAEEVPGDLPRASGRGQAAPGTGHRAPGGAPGGPGGSQETPPGARAGTPGTGWNTPGTSHGMRGASGSRPGQDYEAAPGTAAGIGGSAPPAPFRYREPRRPNWSAALLVLLAVVAGVIIYHVVAANPAGRGTAAAGNAVTPHKPARKHPAAGNTAAPSASPVPANVVISLTAVSEPCWVNLTTPGGATIFQGVVQPGTSETWSERKAVTLQLGNPGAVTLTVDGKSRTGLGSDPVTLSLGPGQPASG